MKGHAQFASMLALAGIRWPPEPTIDNVVFGPFTFAGTIPSAQVLDIDLVNATIPVPVAPLSYDLKLNTQAGISNSGTKQTGFLICDGWGVDFTPIDNPPIRLAQLKRALSFCQVAQATQKPRSMPWSMCARYDTVQATTANNEVRQGGVGCAVPRITMLPAGPWVVNLNTDLLAIRVDPVDVAAGGVTLTSTVTFEGRLHGVFVTQALGQQMGLENLGTLCDLDPAAVAAVLGSRRAQGLQGMIGD